MGKLAPWLLLAALACAPVQVTTEAEPGTDFGAYRSYTIAPHQEENADVGERLEREVEQVLAAKGYRPAPPAAADLLVSFAASGESRTRRTLAGDPDANYYVEQSYVAGTVAIDVFDARSGERIWHGVGERDVLREQDAPEAAAEAARAVLAEFPPQRESPAGGGS
jgi:hypothetical protein